MIFLPQFFLRQGLTIANSLGYTVVLAVASLVGCALGAYLADFIGRRWSIIGASIVTMLAGWIYARFNAASDPEIVLAVGSVLIVAIYVQTAILFASIPRTVPDRDQAARQRHLQHLRPGRDGGVSVRGGRADGELRPARRDLADDRAPPGADRPGVRLGGRAAQSRAGGRRRQGGGVGRARTSTWTDKSRAFGAR